jgi:hypothetical protein
MSRPTTSPRELHVQAPDHIPQLDLLARYMGETRSVATRILLRTGILTTLETAGFQSLEELSEHLEKKGAQ